VFNCGGIAIVINQHREYLPACFISFELKANFFLFAFVDCKKGIQPGQHHFDCLECTDYSLCKNCSEGKFHDHSLKKMIVPKGCEVKSLMIFKVNGIFKEYLLIFTASI